MSVIDRAPTSQDIVQSLELGRLILAASRGLVCADAGNRPEEDSKNALITLSETLRAALDQGSWAVISERLALSPDGKTQEFLSSLGDGTESNLGYLAEAIERATNGTLTEDDRPIIRCGMKLLVAISEDRLAEAQRIDRGHDLDVPWSTPQSSIL